MMTAVSDVRLASEVEYTCGVTLGDKQVEPEIEKKILQKSLHIMCINRVCTLWELTHLVKFLAHCILKGFSLTITLLYIDSRYHMQQSITYM